MQKNVILSLISKVKLEESRTFKDKLEESRKIKDKVEESRTV